MPLSVSCPGCGAAYTLADSLRGRKVRCKHCQETITVGGLDALRGDRPPPVEAVLVGPRKRTAGGRRVRRDDDPPRREEGIPPWVWIVSGVGLLLLLSIGVRVYLVWRATRAIG